MRYRQIAPPEHLKSHIQYFWTLENDLFDLSFKRFGPLADGCPGIIVQRKEAGIYYDESQNVLPQLFLYGQTVKRKALYFQGRFETLGICFYPHSLKSLFGFDAHELTDSCLDLSLLTTRKKEHLEELLLSADAPDRQIELLSAYLSSHIRNGKEGIDSAIHAVLFEILRSRGNLSLPGLQNRIGLSERTLERKFQEQVGISPKLFARISRFQASLQQLKANRNAKLSDIAYDNGYTDQSYFIRSFKEFTGLSPREFKAQADQITGGDAPISLV
jgi:AraC-like DNA-binding protein